MGLQRTTRSTSDSLRAVRWLELSKLSSGRLFVSAVAGLVAAVLSVVTSSAADWPTHRGNAARTGNIDGQPGPATGKVLWAHVSAEHYLASPILAGDNVVVSALGAFNSPVMHALSTTPSAKNRISWTAASPYLKLPTVCAPAFGNVLRICPLMSSRPLSEPSALKIVPEPGVMGPVQVELPLRLRNAPENI